MTTNTLVKEGSAIEVTFMITGCCIGAGMIGLPVMSALTGFIPSSLAMLLCYFFATATGLLILEATLWFDGKVNLISMADFALGKTGKYLTWILFIFLFYCLFVAYIDAGGQLFARILSAFFQTSVSREIGIFTCVSFAACMIYAGTQVVSILSRVFFVGLAISYFALITLGLPNVHGEQLLFMNWNTALSTLPILFICFGYQNMIPTLTHYVKRNVNALRFAIFVGNLIPFCIYLLWNFVILGMLSKTGTAEIKEMIGDGDLVTGLLARASNSHLVQFFAQTFTFFAILTPFIANGLSFVDFLKDGFNISSENKYDPFIYAIVLIPPTLLALFYPHLFLKALSFAGGFVDILLLAIMPVLIVGIGRYVKKIKAPYQVAGGKPFLAAVLLLAITFLLVRT